ncbi:hypothetical protein KAI04_04415 [Candidatus Pacearchaeota archaeon]|nr:hypothetical protein [Candidatus Pacearchaeota archaeon]
MNEELKAVFIICGIILFLFGIGICIDIISDKYEIKAFNSIHGTDYTLGEWFWAENTIKDYHLGTIENKNYQVDLNINKDILEARG